MTTATELENSLFEIKALIQTLHDKLEDVIGSSGLVIMNYMLEHGSINKYELFNKLRNTIEHSDIERLFKIMLNMKLIYVNNDEYKLNTLIIGEPNETNKSIW